MNAPASLKIEGGFSVLRVSKEKHIYIEAALDYFSLHAPTVHILESDSSNWVFHFDFTDKNEAIVLGCISYVNSF